MLNEEIGKWVRVEEQHPTGKTRRFVVCTAAGDPIGEIRWWSGWRKYAFLPGRQTVFEPTCLRDISNFLDRLMVEYKAAKIA